MVLDKETMKASNRDPKMCWECMCCVKICPQQAMAVRGYADFVPLGAQATPLRGSEDIMWTIKFRNGTLKRFKFPIRTTPEGTAVPDGGFKTDPAADDLKSPILMSEPECLYIDALPTLKK